MSVFTHVSEAELAAFLANYEVGEATAMKGIEEGIENTNYFVDTAGHPNAGRFVLTLFERTEYDGLPYFIGVMDHLSRGGIPSARPIANRAGLQLTTLNDRPAVLVERLPGGGVSRPDTAQCAEVAATLARMHRVGLDFEGYRHNCRGAPWWTQAAAKLDGLLDAADRELLMAEIEYQGARDFSSLPVGVIHADLFRDNALFDGARLSGFIDFYYACNDALIYDLAVMINDWLINASGGLDGAAYEAVMSAYAEHREFTASERVHWNAKLRAAALRFWVSRLVDWHFPRAGELTYRKDPIEFRRLLDWHRANPLELPA